jgi:DNA-binding FadR family transcriptional regulator
LDQILDRIKSGDLRRGDSLPGERTIASQMEVSRPTVSVAIDRLVEAGILRSGHGRAGNPEVVSIWIPAGLDDVDAESEARLGPDSIFRVLEARKAVEPRVAQLAALRATDAHFQAMHEAIELLRDPGNDVNRARQAESRFHRIMWRAADNRALEQMMKTLSKSLAPIHRLVLPSTEDYHVGIELHERTLHCLKTGTPAAIEREMIHHLERFETIVADLIQRSPRRQVPDFLLPASE